MIPKITNNGHGYYTISIWSYKDQIWKKQRGSKNLAVVLKQQRDFWQNYGEYFCTKIKKLTSFQKVSHDESENNLRIIVEVDWHIITVTMKKRNLLEMKVITLLKDFDSSELLKVCREALLDDDFSLTFEGKNDIVRGR